MKLATAVKRFDTQLKADGKSQRTREAYLRDLAKLHRLLGADVTSLPSHLTSLQFSSSFRLSHLLGLFLPRSPAKNEFIKPVPRIPVALRHEMRR